MAQKRDWKTICIVALVFLFSLFIIRNYILTVADYPTDLLDNHVPSIPYAGSWKQSYVLKSGWYIPMFNDSNWKTINLPFKQKDGRTSFFRSRLVVPSNSSLRIEIDGCFNEMYVDGVGVLVEENCNDLVITGLKPGEMLLAFTVIPRSNTIQLNVGFIHEP
ncbi:MAG: hypothetical protein V1921_08880 [Candidatus Altiarchaeota archaeon]